MVALEAVTALFAAGWNMLTSVKFPGTEFPISAIIVGAFMAGFGIRVLRYVLGTGISGTSGILPKMTGAAHGIRTKGLDD